jgi:PTS system arbutin/cellobiose/salicin-specific IIC component
MAKDYASISKEIVEKIGGVDNISSVTHCMTRLRFVVKDDSKIDAAGLKQISGVMGYVVNGGQHQVIIGNAVAKAYQEVLKLGNFGNESDIAKGNVKEPLTPKKIASNILDALVSTMSPLIPAIIGGSMIKLLVLLLNMAGILADTSYTYKLLTIMGDGAFFFLPIMVAASAAKKFNTNMFIAMGIAGALVHPSFIEIMASIAEGEKVVFLGIAMTSVKYTYTVVPALVMTWLLSYIEQGVDRITPEVTKNFLKPMLIFLVASPIAIMLVGPAGVWFGNGISSLVYMIHDHLGFLAVAIMGAIWPLLVITGMHRVFTPTILMTIAATGMEAMVMPSEIGANLSLGGVALAVAWKTRNHELRQTSLAAASSAILAGISEPGLYGVAVRLKRPLIASIITGFVCGAVAGLAGLASRSMAAPGVATAVQFFDPKDSTSILWTVIVMVLAVVLSFILTLVLGFDDLKEGE